jgi:vesicle coat complex subunit
MLPVPEDRRPVPSPVEERIESTAIYNTHSWTDVLDNIVCAGDGTVKVSAEYLLHRLGEVGTLNFIRSHNAMVRMLNVSKNAEVGNVMVLHALSQSLSLTKSEHQEYISRTPIIFKFLNSTKIGGITFRYAGVDWI